MKVLDDVVIYENAREIFLQKNAENTIHFTFEQRRKAEGKGKQKLHFRLQSENKN